MTSSTPRRPGLDLSEIELDAMLKRLNLANLRRVYHDMIVRAEEEQWSYRDFLALIVAEEVAHRKQTRLQRLTRRAHFPYFKTIDDFDFTLQSSLRVALLGSYLSPDFVTEGRSLVFHGETGRGKTHLAIAIGYRAIQNGFETLFTTAAQLIEDLSNAGRHGRLHGALLTYTHPHVLVIDEVGYLTYGPEAANVLYHVVNDRHLHKRPMVFTTNKPIKTWGRVLHDPDLAAAILDRVLERGRWITLDGPSGRTKHLKLASGMRLRLGFAVAAHLDPDVLIVDEVLAVGDAGFQKKCLAIMGDLRTGGRTVLFVSHNMAAVENLCSRGVWIDDGRLKEDGPAQSVIASYMSTFASAPQIKFDFTDVKNRRGNGEIRYTGVTFLSLDGQPQHVTRSGDGIIIRLSFRAERPIPRPSFGFRLFTELGTLITETSTWHHAIEIPVLPAGEGVIDLRIESLNLMPARYFLSIWLTGESAVVYDGLEHSAVVDVETANIYQAGRTWDSRFGVVFFPQRWILNGVPVRGASEYDSSASMPSRPPDQDS